MDTYTFKDNEQGVEVCVTGGGDVIGSATGGALFNPKRAVCRELLRVAGELESGLELAGAYDAAMERADRLAGRVEELEANRPKCHTCGATVVCLEELWGACGECWDEERAKAEELEEENERLRKRLEEAEGALRGVRDGYRAATSGADIELGMSSSEWHAALDAVDAFLGD